MSQKRLYILKYFDTNLIKFRFVSDPMESTTVEIVEIYKENSQYFPLGIKPKESSLISWIKSRTIPKNREFVHKILMELNLSFDDIEGIVSISKSLSLNDCYWIVDSQFVGEFKDYNLYDNDFNKTLSLLAYTGYASMKHKDFISSPEFTTNGMLAKAWRKNPQGKEGIYLYKAGSSGFANSGKEPYSEFYAYQIAKTMELNITPYALGKWKGNLNSVCELFCTKEFSFIPIYYLVNEGGWKAVLKYYKNLGEEYYDDLIDMIIFDAIILNTDRHFGNFGLLVDNKTNTIISTAPIFDNGLSLFQDALDDDLEKIEEYANTKIMKNAGGFLEFLETVIDNKSKKKITKLINFRFEKNSRFNLKAKRLKKIEEFIQQRVQKILNLQRG
ncbi:MAG: XRE family transcriptional regulator [Campylobacterota bacterium]|nr:XRE family transcriptional regulator [Campylobacterota bacterium]